MEREENFHPKWATERARERERKKVKKVHSVMVGQEQNYSITLFALDGRVERWEIGKLKCNQIRKPLQPLYENDSKRCRREGKERTFHQPRICRWWLKVVRVNVDEHLNRWMVLGDLAEQWKLLGVCKSWWEKVVFEWYLKCLPFS